MQSGPSSLERPAAGPSSADGVFGLTAVRDLMWRTAGLLRTRAELQGTAAQLEDACARQRATLERSAQPSAGEWRRFNLLTVAA